MSRCQLILASSSPRRRELLQEAGYTFEVIVPREDAERAICSGTGPAELVAELAYRKAADVRQQLLRRPELSEAWILAADTVAECHGQLLGKPRDEDDARRMLQALSGRRHRVLSGVCVWPPPGDDSSPLVRVAETWLQMDQLTDRQLAEYLHSGQWGGKAGAFGFQDRLGWVHVVEGSQSNVVGLPLELLRAMFHDLGFVGK